MAQHDKMGHHAADGALAMGLASIVAEPERNDFYTANGTRRGVPPGATKTDPEDDPMDPLNTTNWPTESREVFWAQAVAQTGTDYGLGQAKL